MEQASFNFMAAVTIHRDFGAQRKSITFFTFSSSICHEDEIRFHDFSAFYVWEVAQAGIKIAGRNINNLRYADDTTLMAESAEKLKSLLMKVKVESGKSWLKAQHSEN